MTCVIHFFLQVLALKMNLFLGHSHARLLGVEMLQSFWKAVWERVTKALK